MYALIMREPRLLSLPGGIVDRGTKWHMFRLNPGENSVLAGGLFLQRYATLRRWNGFVRQLTGKKDTGNC